ncbi:hypothetical protein HS1genome_2117 [Sulfodiicoccus acidiphilus]|uniref:FdrA domain protein n=1 Tax=Sulfodiicoccus acidiphilus TaxID=1670455 RepID=A0A348B6C6_9CREN|nr:hypothetical protein [Sulfodiicoccus acidiphilus]BBD73728.1 hypothetical protein HS1genome_2117 [Sulfodiicoccus acidiphilus]GGT97915.1 hypothetical protein GCM10007116_14340 [Sulfodiicoccus acidiphilus]
MKGADSLASQRITVINVGSSHFHEELKRQGVTTLQVNWRPPVELEKDIEDILKEVL